MSTRVAGALLFAVAFLTVPFPMLGLGGSLVPAARFCQLGFVMLGLVSQEGTGGMVGLFTALLVAHGVVYLALLAAIVWLVSRFVLARLTAGFRLGLTVAACVASIGFASLLPVYDTQFHHSSAHARLWELYR